MNENSHRRIVQISHTSVKSHCIMSSGRTPKDSGLHSFKREWQMLRTAPSLTVNIFANNLSTVYAATLARLSDGSFVTSKKGVTPGNYTIVNHIYTIVYIG